jgi:hypothetical protein
MRLLAKVRSSRKVFLAALLVAAVPARAAFAQNAPTPAPTGPAGTPPPAAPPSTPPEPPNTTVAPAPASGAPVSASGPSGAAVTSSAPAGEVVAPPPSATSGLHVPPIEILPPSAYPDPRTGVRGIVGGSLWLEPDLQGMQWPYYPTTGLGISGSGWVDTGIRKDHAGQPVSGMANSGLGTGENQGTQFVQQSRFVLRATPTWTIHDQFFVQGQMELVAAQISTKNQFTWGADDAWIRAGMWNKFDILFGRFQAWEVYHYGMGLDLYTIERTGAIDSNPNGIIPSIYGLTYMYGRQDTIGQGAIHLYPFDFLRFEVGFQYGQSGADNVAGVRPVGIADFHVGPAVVRLKGGAEFIDNRNQTTGAKDEQINNGYAGALQVILDPYLEFGANMAWTWQDQRDSMGRISSAGRNQQYSAGGFLNARLWKDLLIGGGINYSYFVDTRYDTNVKRNDSGDQLQPFGAIQYTLWNHLMIKGVFAYAKGDSNATPSLQNVFQNEMWSARLRLLYLL